MLPLVIFVDMTGLVLWLCCNFAVLLCPSVQAYGKVHIHVSMNLTPYALEKKCWTLEDYEEINIKRAQ